MDSVNVMTAVLAKGSGFSAGRMDERDNAHPSTPHFGHPDLSEGVREISHLSVAGVEQGVVARPLPLYRSVYIVGTVSMAFPSGVTQGGVITCDPVELACSYEQGGGANPGPVLRPVSRRRTAAAAHARHVGRDPRGAAGSPRRPTTRCSGCRCCHSLRGGSVIVLVVFE
jgi:hypothetical protein